MVEFSPSGAAAIGSEGAEPATGRQVGDGYMVRGYLTFLDSQPLSSKCHETVELTGRRSILQRRLLREKGFLGRSSEVQHKPSSPLAPPQSPPFGHTAAPNCQKARVRGLRVPRTKRAEPAQERLLGEAAAVLGVNTTMGRPR